MTIAEEILGKINAEHLDSNQTSRYFDFDNDNQSRKATQTYAFTDGSRMTVVVTTD
jgi:hypothetical protein